MDDFKTRFVFDLAVALRIDPARIFILGIEEGSVVVTFLIEEDESSPAADVLEALAVAALRFWLSRQIAAEEFAGQDGVLVKDPQHFARLLLQHRVVAVGLPLAL